MNEDFSNVNLFLSEKYKLIVINCNWFLFLSDLPLYKAK